MNRHTWKRASTRSLWGIACLTVGTGAFAECKLAKIVALPVTMVDMHPLVRVQINGMEASFVADSGAFYSMMTPASAAEFKLKTSSLPWGLRVTGIGGEAGNVGKTQVKEFTLAGFPIHNVDFIVGGGESGGNAAGLLGQNIFSIGDVEYDLAKGVIRIVREEGCKNANLAYWTIGTSVPYSMMAIDSPSLTKFHTAGEAMLNGHRIHVMFDTGAHASILSMRAAKLAGFAVDAPGVIDAGYSRGIGRNEEKTYIANFVSFKLGDEETKNARLRIEELDLPGVDMLIGADFFLSHHIYVAQKQNKLFFTYNGGPVFNLTASRTLPAAPTAPASPASQPALTAPPTADAADAAVSRPPTDSSASGEPKTADEFSRRGTAFAARRDFVRAIADLTRATELAPQGADYFYELGIAQWQNKEPAAAMAAFDQTLKLKPDHVLALVGRAELNLLKREAAPAVSDLLAADRAAAREADVRLRLAGDFTRAERPGDALAQLDLWIAAHNADARRGEALSQRCWVRALTGEDLTKALDDCNAALKLVAKSSVASAGALTGRGLVRLRLGDYDKSIHDYDAALLTNPKLAWALYGRGVDQLRRGRVPEGQADIASAKALWPKVSDAFEKQGLRP